MFFSNKIVFSDKAQFYLNGFVSLQSFHICWSENPRGVVEKQMHPHRATIRWEFWTGSPIGRFFFGNASDQALTVNFARYREKIIQFLFLNGKLLMYMTSCCNRTVPHAIRPEKQFYLLFVWFHVLVATLDYPNHIL